MNMKEEKTNWNELVQRESARVEWKENVANPQGVVKTLSAFANDFQQVGGGRVLCGLKEEKNKSGEPAAKVVGLDEKRLKEVKNKVLDYCHRYVEPPLTPEVTEYPVEHEPSRRILAFAVTSSQYAHRYRTKKEDVNYYIRINDEPRPADGLIPQLLERKKVWPPYLDQTHPDAALDAIDLMALKEFLGRMNLPLSLEEYLEPNVRFRGDVQDLVTYPPGRTDRAVPRNFTLLLFGREPHLFFRGAYAIFSVYQGKDRGSDRSQRFVLFGPIPELIQNIMARLQIYMGINIDRTLGVFSPDQNRERFSEYAVKEAIVNAFVHRDYHSHEPVRITLFEDRVEVTSPGGSYASIDPEKIRKGEIYTAWRNPSLAWFMEKLKFAQNEGQGIRAIIRLTKEAAGKEPEFHMDSHWFRVDIPAYIPLLDSFREKVEVQKAGVDFDINTELPVMQEDFDQLKDLLMAGGAHLDVKLREIGDSWDAIHPGSDKKGYTAPMAKMRRFLKKLSDENSDYHKLIKGSEKALECTQKLLMTYNKFAQWLTLPQVPEI